MLSYIKKFINFLETFDQRRLVTMERYQMPEMEVIMMPVQDVVKTSGKPGGSGGGIVLPDDEF